MQPSQVACVLENSMSYEKLETVSVDTKPRPAHYWLLGLGGERHRDRGNWKNERGSLSQCLSVSNKHWNFFRGRAVKPAVRQKQNTTHKKNLGTYGKLKNIFMSIGIRMIGDITEATNLRLNVWFWLSKKNSFSRPKKLAHTVLALRRAEASNLRLNVWFWLWVKRTVFLDWKRCISFSRLGY